MRLWFKIVLLASLSTLLFVAYHFWLGMTPGERYHIVDKVRAGDMEGALDSLRFKAGEAVDRQRTRMETAAERALRDSSARLIDEAAGALRRETDAAAESARQRVDDALNASAAETP